MSERIMMPMDMTVLKFIICYMVENGFAPSYREIQNGIGGMSLHKVLESIKCLEELGKIKVKPKTPRAISVRGYEYVKIKQAAGV